jgi:alpha-D-glucose phosphate-specific phosphoglucomutase
LKNNPIKFGTDGWRAVIAEDFTFDNVRYCAQGMADYMKEAGLAGHGLVVGYDTRFASEDFAAAVAEVAAGNGITVYLTPQATPTPVVSYGVLARHAGAGVVITASHNGGQWNGFKIKDSNGSSAADEITSGVVANIDKAYAARRVKRMPLAEATQQGLIVETDLTKIYFEQIARLVDIERLRGAGLELVIDPMYGAGAGYLAKLLEGGNTRLTEIRSERNPLFPGIRPEPIMPHLGELAEAVKKQGASTGLATDGDADRMGIIDETGKFVTQLQVFALLALYLLEVRGERGPIIKTLTASSMVDRLGEIYSVPVYETAVGFKYVAPLMIQEEAIMGGEESGGYGFRGHVIERDGILANLYFLDLMARTGKKPSELIDYLYSKVGPHYYRRVDVKFPEDQRQTVIDRVRDKAPDNIDGVEVAGINTADGFKFILKDNTWLLIRFSGTEPLLRIYTETDTPERVDRLLRIGREIAGV